MKKVIVCLTISFSGIIISANAQKTSVPAAVKSKFAATYPDVKKVKWGKEGKDFEGEFGYKGHEMSVVIDAKGNLLETETEITISALPTPIKEYVNKNYQGAKIKEAAEIVDAKGMKTFEAEVNGKDLIFDEKGNLVKK